MIKNKIVLFPAILLIFYFVGCKDFQDSYGGAPYSNSRFLNLDFENCRQKGIATGWYQWGNGYAVKVDSNISFNGNRSMNISKIADGNFASANRLFPVEDAKGKHVRYTGYIKTEEITQGYAGLWWRVDGKTQGEVLGFDNMSGRGASGTTDWKMYSIEMDIDTGAAQIHFGVILSGNGTAWFDNLQIKIDGEVYDQSERVAFVPDEDQINWLKDNSIHFSSVDPQNDNSDLNDLKSIIGDAKIVSLGEATHGTSEFFKMKHRIVKFLAEEMNFTLFAIEANMPEARRVNEYILTGKGDPGTALAGMYFWTWNTKEVLDMIEWMREFNASGSGRIEFYGFDLQYPQVAIENVKTFIDVVEPEYSKQLLTAYDKVMDLHKGTIGLRNNGLPDVYFELWYEESNKVLIHMQDKRNEYLKKYDSTIVDEAIQDARIVVQSAAMRMQSKPSRDYYMALNTEWILEQYPPNSKIVLWAHNGHIRRKGGNYIPMGKYLTEKYSNEMIVVGFAFNEGFYTARGPNGLTSYTTSPSELGSVELALHLTGFNQFILDLRNVTDESNSNWLKTELLFRSIGATAMDYAFFPCVLTDEYDVVIYFNKTTPSNLLINNIKQSGRN